MSAWRMLYSQILLQKAENARCPFCNSEIVSDIEEEKVLLHECKNCLGQFAIEKIGPMYYIVAYDEEIIEKK